ncbi:MAG: ferric iron reductase [Firmicutes bacterium]|nr:ferric iron reductase [Bacillota bacterium]
MAAVLALPLARTSRCASQPGWLDAAELARPGNVALCHLLARHAAWTGSMVWQAADLRWFHAYAASVVAPALTGYVLRRRVPDLGLENVRLRFDGRGLPVAVALLRSRAAERGRHRSHAALWLPDDARLLAWLRRRLFDHHLALVAEALTAVRGLGAGLLWTSVAAACAGVLMRLGRPEYAHEALAAVAKDLFGPGSLIHGRGYWDEAASPCVRRAICRHQYRLLGWAACVACGALSGGPAANQFQSRRYEEGRDGRVERLQGAAL